ncbi:MAG: hypothetical protein COC15_01715 [Legionellales bacterium]|nr:MAG: hypothetical protein COC15_01715 [Legionellales bacterium]
MLLSIIIGSAIAFIPNIIAYRINFKHRSVDPKLITLKLYGAELVKFLLMGLLFALAIISEKLQLGIVFIAFIVVQILWWVFSAKVLLQKINSVVNHQT